MMGVQMDITQVIIGSGDWLQQNAHQELGMTWDESEVEASG
jgi:hypothetical protein